MSSRLTDIEAKIATEAEACAYQKKKSKFLGGLFVPKRQLVPQCEMEARARYADELAAAQNEAYGWEAQTMDAFNREAAEGVDPQVIQIIIVALLIVLAIAWILA